MTCVRFSALHSEIGITLGSQKVARSSYQRKQIRIEVINAAVVFSAPMVHVGIDYVRCSSSSFSHRPVRTAWLHSSQLRSLATQPLAVQEEIQLRHALSASAIVFSKLLQQAEKRILVRVCMCRLRASTQATGRLVVEALTIVERVVRPKVIWHSDSSGQWAEVESGRKHTLSKSLRLVLGGLDWPCGCGKELELSLRLLKLLMLLSLMMHLTGHRGIV
jgi:hypothetical protein